ncbi:MAG: polysaccharide biosynthesis/export family protein, partial [Myxococcota bacterium]
MSRGHIYILAALSVSLLCAFGCGPKPQLWSPAQYNELGDPRALEYVIGVSDTLTVNVWQRQEGSGTVSVRPDGTITLPLIGDLKA